MCVCVCVCGGGGGGGGGSPCAISAFQGHGTRSGGGAVWRMINKETSIVGYDWLMHGRLEYTDGKLKNHVKKCVGHCLFL